ncbi:hypothetical protein KM043_013625 [Ampulex compressa]|nr:hypothetical protein KM043_013625 [Ampulex compressa]
MDECGNEEKNTMFETWRINGIAIPADVIQAQKRRSKENSSDKKKNVLVKLTIFHGRNIDYTFLMKSQCRILDVAEPEYSRDKITIFAIISDRGFSRITVK